ncbi:MAG: transposase [Gemmataceae bacterium]
MRFYQGQHRFYCGVDLHARTMYLRQFLSYCRLVRCDHESAGKKKGSGGKKIGNAHLRWAFAEATCLWLRQSERAKAWLKRQEKKRGKAKALAVLGAKLARGVYHMLLKKEAFDEAKALGWTPQARRLACGRGGRPGSGRFAGLGGQARAG